MRVDPGAATICWVLLLLSSSFFLLPGGLCSFPEKDTVARASGLGERGPAAWLGLGWLGGLTWFNLAWLGLAWRGLTEKKFSALRAEQALLIWFT